MHFWFCQSSWGKKLQALSAFVGSLWRISIGVCKSPKQVSLTMLAVVLLFCLKDA